VTREPTPIAVFVGSWLPYSETFVFEQLRLQRATRAWVIAGSRTRHAARFPYQPVTHLHLGHQIGYRYLGVGGLIERTLRESGARLVFAHFGLNGAFALPFAERLGLPLAVMFHGHDVGGLLPQNRFKLRYLRYQRLARRLFDYASLLLCASKELLESLERLGAPRAKLRLHPLGIDTDSFTPPSAERDVSSITVLMVGRLVEKKGMSYGLRAFAEVLARGVDARLSIIGEGPLFGALSREATELGIRPAVDFLGSLPPARVRAAMQRAHVLVAPSYTTPAGDRESGVIVLKEAGATGLPVVATQHGGIPEIVEHERTGLLVPERSVPELASALERVLRDPFLRARMGGFARGKISAEYDSRRQVARLEHELLRLV
jgi:colanic acid/amylovoran/stewartan biosynthesis glycosyltransferase WcaL/AmsK/CpsK